MPQRFRSKAATLLALSAVLALLAARPAGASLASTLHRFVLVNSTILDAPGGAVSDSLSPLIVRLAERGTSLPATSTLPGVTYRPIIEEGVFEREPGPLGSSLLERADTVGHGRVALETAYLYADLERFDGAEFGPQVDYRSSALLRNAGGAFRESTRLDFDRLTVAAHQFTLSATYGITDRWDVNVLAPLVRTELDVRADRREVMTTQSPMTRTVHRAIVRAHDVATGIGDVLVRTKYRFPSFVPLDVAAVLELRTPTGAEKDFHGLGDWILAPLLVASRDFGPHEAHLNLGVEVNADDLSRSRARYGVGGSLHLLEPVAFFADVLGSSGLANDEFEVHSGANVASSSFLDQFKAGQIETNTGVTAFQFVPRSDIVDLAVGLKVNLFYRGSFFVSAIVPVVRDVLRADVIPAGGVEFNF